jgi:hypothetical protein
MSGGNKSIYKKVGKSKLFNLKEWLTLAEAAKYLSALFGEEVGEDDRCLLLRMPQGSGLTVECP